MLIWRGPGRQRGCCWIWQRALQSGFRRKTRDKNLVDFNDLEHEALKVLIRVEEDGARAYTDAADELSMQYREVLVDEYQDSNLVQEELLKAVSRERFGQHNVFMVGDVKSEHLSVPPGQTGAVSGEISCLPV